MAQLSTSEGQFLLDKVEALATPLLIYDRRRLQELIDKALNARDRAEFDLLYSVKASAFSEVLRFLASGTDGFAVSSMFEARLIREMFPSQLVHFTSPGLRSQEVPDIAALCDCVSLNSRTQLLRFGGELSKTASVGVRINTRVSSVPDPSYDPCRVRSKLGVPVEEVASVLASAPVRVEGLHIHTNADSTEFADLLKNVQVLSVAVPVNYRFNWINLGGGYLFEEAESLEPLIEATTTIRDRFAAKVLLEPGAALVRGAAFLVASVIDLFEVDGTRLAVLDTTVNHMPEVLEFKYQPDVVGREIDGPMEYILAGSTCLAGDVFGTYRFGTQLEIGSKVIFGEVGAYTLSKAHRFNGINLPEVGMLNSDGSVSLLKSWKYEDYKELWMANV